jgi:hypothetical protein
LEIVLVGLIIFLSKLVELFCSQKKYNSRKSFIVGATIMLLTFFVAYSIGYMSRDNTSNSLESFDLIIAVGVALVVSIGVGYKCMLASD